MPYCIIALLLLWMQVLLRGIGRNVIIDQGYYPPALRLLLRIVELAWLTDIMVVFASWIDDYKYLQKQQQQGKTQ